MITLYVSEKDFKELIAMRGVNVKIKEDVETKSGKELIKNGLYAPPAKLQPRGIPRDNT